MNFNKKDVLKFSLFVFFFLSLLVAWLGFGERGFIHLYHIDKEREARIERIKKLDQENKELLDEIVRLRTDKETIESLGRRELGLIKEGEILYRFNREKGSSLSKEKGVRK